MWQFKRSNLLKINCLFFLQTKTSPAPSRAIVYQAWLWTSGLSDPNEGSLDQRRALLWRDETGNAVEPRPPSYICHSKTCRNWGQGRNHRIAFTPAGTRRKWGLKKVKSGSLSLRTRINSSSDLPWRHFYFEVTTFVATHIFKKIETSWHTWCYVWMQLQISFCFKL